MKEEKAYTGDEAEEMNLALKRNPIIILVMLTIRTMLCTMTAEN